MLTQSEQLRSERPDVDPEVELEHWRRLLAKFASIVEHCKTPECVAYITYLVQVQSNLIKVYFLCFSLFFLSRFVQFLGFYNYNVSICL